MADGVSAITIATSIDGDKVRNCKHLTADFLNFTLELCSNFMKYCPIQLHSEYILH